MFGTIPSDRNTYRTRESEVDSGGRGVKEWLRRRGSLAGLPTPHQLTQEPDYRPCVPYATEV